MQLLQHGRWIGKMRENLREKDQIIVIIRDGNVSEVTDVSNGTISFVQLAEISGLIMKLLEIAPIETGPGASVQNPGTWAERANRALHPTIEIDPARVEGPSR